MKCLVTGGAGFIGSNLAVELEKMSNEVTVVDNLHSGNRKNLNNFKGNFMEADISKPFLIKEKFDAIFHQASITDPRHGNDEETIRKNIAGFTNMLKLAEKHNSRLVYASTASLYGNTAAPQKEEQEELLSAYAQSKLIMDEMALQKKSTMHIVGLRYFNVFGPGESFKGRPASMVYHLIRQMKKGLTPKLFKSGEQKRDFIYVKDCVAANLKALEAESGIYNVGTGIATSFNGLVGILNVVLGTSLKPEYFDMPFAKKTYQSNTQAHTEKAERILKFVAAHPLKYAIKEYAGMIE